jgi:histidinol phosphatase-like enzyme (inositol monophosphatase family)
MAGTDLLRAARVAGAAADAARREVLPRFRHVAVERKADGTPVTEADREAERAMRAVLLEAFPDIAVVGEEEGGETADRYWIVDPIDGTLSFSRGVPLFGTLIALVEGGETQVGVIDLPALDERIVGVRGGGAERNGVPVTASRERDLGAAIVACGDFYCFDLWNERPFLERLVAEAPKLRAYTDAFGHAQTVGGSVDVMVDLALKPWDIAATRLLIEEAGGACRVIDRSEQHDYGWGLVFGSPALVDQLSAWLEGGG